MIIVTKQTSSNSRTNLRHTLACNKTKQPTDIIAKNLLQQNLTYYMIQQINGKRSKKNNNWKSQEMEGENLKADDGGKWRVVNN